MHIRKEFYRYVLPSMLAFALSGVYAIADGFFVGNALGDDALAAINVAFPLTAFLQAVGTGIGMGGAVEYAISMGSGDKDRCNRFFGVSLIALFVSGLALTLVFWLFAPQVLSLFGASWPMSTSATSPWAPCSRCWAPGWSPSSATWAALSPPWWP